jgi:hypothetical protein
MSQLLTHLLERENHLCSPGINDSAANAHVPVHCTACTVHPKSHYFEFTLLTVTVFLFAFFNLIFDVYCTCKIFRKGKVANEPSKFQAAWMRSSRVSGWDLAEYSRWDPAEYSGWDLAEWLERLTVNVAVATVLGSIPASSDTAESEGRQMKQCWISYITKSKNPSFRLQIWVYNISFAWTIFCISLPILCKCHRKNVNKQSPKETVEIGRNCRNNSKKSRNLIAHNLSEMTGSWEQFLLTT